MLCFKGLIKLISNNAHQHIYTRAHEEAPKDEVQEKQDKPKAEKKVKMSKAEKRAEAEEKAES